MVMRQRCKKPVAQCIINPDLGDLPPGENLSAVLLVEISL